MSPCWFRAREDRVPPDCLLRLAAVAFLLLAGSCARGPDAPVRASDVGELRPGTGILRGYLAADQLPDSLALLPPPPAAGSARLAADREAYEAALSATEPARWDEAAREATLAFPQSVSAFGALLGVEIGEETTPNLAMVLRRSLADAALATYAAKDHYRRERPFAAEGVASCSPQQEASLRANGSYPSGHAAIGWTWALVLTELAPDRADALLQRGYEFGQSRVVCRVHWQSDVDAGRLVGAAVFARLQADPVFAVQMERARAELEQATAGPKR